MNPFHLAPHTPEAYFCDRKKETEDLISMLDNGQNVTLISPRRYGKTGLIYHIFDQLSRRKDSPDLIYLDIYVTANSDDFLTVFTEAVAKALKKKSLIKNLLNFMGRIRPVVSQDPVSGEAKFSFTIQSDADRRYSLKALMDFLEQRPGKVVIAIDEFQQLRSYKGMPMEALLRTYIQPLTNVNFIFSGSRKHIMAEMFTLETSPFYESAAVYSLDRIDRGTYASFIREQFKNQSKSITQEAVDYILDWTYRHTYYTQFLCNRVFSATLKEAGLINVLIEIDALLKESQDSFLERRSLITPKQWKFLSAVAKEGVVTKPTASAFLQKYGLGAPSSASQTLSSLLDKELLLETKTLTGSSYRIYNVFFSRWLERL